MSEKTSDAIAGPFHWLRDRYVIELETRHREEHIILTAQRDQFAAQAKRLKEQNARQAATIQATDAALVRKDAMVSERDKALENAQTRIKYLQEELVLLSAEAKLFRGLDNFKVTPGRTYTIRPRLIEVECRDGEYPMPTFYRFKSPAAVHLTF